MIIERTKEEVIFKLSGNFNLDDLQDITDYLEFTELTKKNKTSQKEVDNLVNEIKKGRWEKTKNRIGL